MLPLPFPSRQGKVSFRAMDSSAIDKAFPPTSGRLGQAFRPVPGSISVGQAFPPTLNVNFLTNVGSAISPASRFRNSGGDRLAAGKGRRVPGRRRGVLFPEQGSGKGEMNADASARACCRCRRPEFARPLADLGTRPQGAHFTPKDFLKIPDAGLIKGSLANSGFSLRCGLLISRTALADRSPNC
jgi:hypothetical protein